MGRPQMERRRLPRRAARPGDPLRLSERGYGVWMDDMAVLKDAKNVENAKLFQSFVMAPENAALISVFARYANGIKGTEAFIPEDMKDASEVAIPKEFEAAGKFILTCPPDVDAMYTQIWTEVLK